MLGDSEHFVSRHPYSRLGMGLDDGLDLLVDLVKVVAVDDGCEVLDKVLLEPHGPVVALLRLTQGVTFEYGSQEKWR